MDKRYFSNDEDHFPMKAYTDVIFVLRNNSSVSMYEKGAFLDSFLKFEATRFACLA